MIGITIYKDTIKEHDDDYNLAEVFVTEDFLEKYFQECQKNYFDIMLDEWLDIYTADNTMDFYEYAKLHNAILDIKNL